MDSYVIRTITRMKTPLPTTLAALVLPILASAQPSTATPSIADLYADSFHIGVALSAGQILGTDPSDTRVIAGHFNSYTAENAMKWESIHPTEGNFSFEIADALADLGEKNDAFLVGHTLLWHQQTPDWVFEDSEGKPASRDQVLARLRHHITTVVTRYKGRFDGWDVVNEALNEDGTMRESNWREALGDDYIAEAFMAAHAADPEANLYYNDYNLYKPEKRAGAVAIVKDLQARGIPIHGVGIQGHYGLDNPPLEDNHYRALFAVFLKHRETLHRVTFWNLNDGTSWKNNWPVRGRTDYPVIFDRENNPKSTYRALIDLKLAYDEAP